MGKKSLIIGAMTNYDYAAIRPWVRSIEMSGFDGDKAMIVFDAPFETVEELLGHGFAVVAFNKDDTTRRFTYKPFGNLTIHLERFLHIYNYLSDNDRWRNYDYVVTTDVKDVVFQSDPIRWIEEYGISSLVAGSESIRYKDEPWGNQNLLDCYGPFFHNIFKENVIYNVGTLGGRSEYIKDLVFNIFTNGINRPIPIVDQAVFNVLIQTQPYKNSTVFLTQSDGWALQAGTTADPSKIESFRPHLLESEPIIKDGIAYTAAGDKFCIFHQYDRIPGVREQVIAKYV